MPVEHPTPDAAKREVVKVVPLTTVALNREITPAILLNWLAGFGLTGAVGYDTNTDLILRVVPRGYAAGAEQRLVNALANTFRWLAASPQNANPPQGYTDNVLWEACVLAKSLPVSGVLADALVEFYRVAGHREQALSESVRRELTEALRTQQPGDLHRRENVQAQDFWQGLWLDVLTHRNTFLECFRDDAFLSLMEATFGKEKSEPLKPVVSTVREATEAYGESSLSTRGRYLNAARTEGEVLLSQIAGELADCAIS